MATVAEAAGRERSASTVVMAVAAARRYARPQPRVGVVASSVIMSTMMTAAESRLEGARCRRWLKATVPRGAAWYWRRPWRHDATPPPTQ
jgi:hypothetical protein